MPERKIIQNAQLTDTQFESLETLLITVREHDHGLPAIYKHLLVLTRDTPSNFLYYSLATPTSSPKLVGFLSLYFFYQHRCEVSLVVHPDYRQQGIANALFQMALPLCQTKHIKALLFSTPSSLDPTLLHMKGAQFHHSEYHLQRNQTAVAAITQPRLNVRGARMDDLPMLCRLDEQCFENSDADMKDRFISILNDEGYHILVAELDERVIGKAHLRLDPEETLLSDLAILPTHQHQGFGGELLSHALQYLLEQHLTCVGLDVETADQPILKLYLEHGFEVVNKIDFYNKTIEI